MFKLNYQCSLGALYQQRLGGYAERGFGYKVEYNPYSVKLVVFYV